MKLLRVAMANLKASRSSERMKAISVQSEIKASSINTGETSTLTTITKTNSWNRHKIIHRFLFSIFHKRIELIHAFHQIIPLSKNHLIWSKERNYWNTIKTINKWCKKKLRRYICNYE